MTVRAFLAAYDAIATGPLPHVTFDPQRVSHCIQRCCAGRRRIPDIRRHADGRRFAPTRRHAQRADQSGATGSGVDLPDHRAGARGQLEGAGRVAGLRLRSEPEAAACYSMVRESRRFEVHIQAAAERALARRTTVHVSGRRVLDRPAQNGASAWPQHVRECD